MRGLIVVVFIAVMSAACADDPCCTSNDECVDGAACFEGVCALRCESSAMCDEGQTCAALSAEGAGVCRDSSAAASTLARCAFNDGAR